MTTITDKLQAAKEALFFCHLYFKDSMHERAEQIHKAHAEFPDPDAVGELVRALRDLASAVEQSAPMVHHSLVGGKPVNILDPGEAELFRCCLNSQAALAKLEEKP